MALSCISAFSTVMGNHQSANHPGQLSLAIPLWVGTTLYNLVSEG